MPIPPLTPALVATLAVLAGALVLFVWNRVRLDVAALVVLLALVALGLVTPAEAASGFGNEAVVTVAAMLVLSTGLIRTGAVDVLSRLMARVAGGSPWRLLLVLVAIVTPLSAFINNTAAVSILLPVVLGLSRAMGATPSRLLMPLSFAAQLGGTLTLIGTSTNLLVAGIVLELGLGRLHIFDVTGPAAIVAAAGLVYLLTVGRWLTPERKGEELPLDPARLRSYLSSLVVEPGSPLEGRPVAEARMDEAHGLEVLALDRGGRRVHPESSNPIRAGDRVLVRGEPAAIKSAEESGEARIARVELPQEPGAPEEEEGEEAKLVEVVVPPRSRLSGRRVEDIRRFSALGVSVLAVQRHRELLHGRVEDVVLRQGDVLLVEGTQAALLRLHERGELALVGVVSLPAKRTRKMGLAVGILAVVVLLPALGIAPIVVTAIGGCAAMFLTGCLRPDEAYEQLDWMVIVLLGAILPLGIAMQRSGAAELLAALLLRAVGAQGPYVALAAVYLLTSLLTEVASNNGAAVVLTPIAAAAASALGVSPMPFVIAVMLAASNSFMTPVGYQTNAFILGPGGYRFADFLRVGGPLNAILVAVATFAIPLFFPFDG